MLTIGVALVQSMTEKANSPSSPKPIDMPKIQSVRGTLGMVEGNSKDLSQGGKSTAPPPKRRISSDWVKAQPVEADKEDEQKPTPSPVPETGKGSSSGVMLSSDEDDDDDGDESSKEAKVEDKPPPSSPPHSGAKKTGDPPTAEKEDTIATPTECVSAVWCAHVHGPH